MLDIQLLKDTFKGRNFRDHYKDRIEKAHAIRIHADGEFPKELISLRRPSEPDVVLQFRENIYQPITQSTIKRIREVIGKIRRSPDWRISFEPDSPLKDYTEKNLPKYGNLTNYVFNYYLDDYLVDPNGIVVILFDFDAEGYLTPYPVTFGSESVLDYKKGEYVIIKEAHNEFLVVTNEGYYWYSYDTNRGQYILDDEYIHGLNTMPAFDMPSPESKGIKISRIDSTIPHLNEAVREYSDLQAEVVNHTHSEAWEYGGECKGCMGMGSIVPEGTTDRVVCTRCEGTRVEPRGPYSTIKLKIPESITDSTNIPTPPKGYIQKDVEIVKIQDQRVDAHIYKALASINFEFLNKTPLSESGIAKEVDRDEANNTIYNIAEDLVHAMDLMYYFINELRYVASVPNPEIRHTYLPIISVPEKFDIISADYYESAIKSAKEAGIAPTIIAEMEKDYIERRFNADDYTRDVLKLSIDLNPLSGIEVANIVVYLSNSLISRQDAVIAANIKQFVERAMQEHEGFIDMNKAEQQRIIQGYASTIVPPTSTVSRVREILNGVNGG